MKKKYLRIQINRSDKVISTNYFLLSENVTGWLEENDCIRLFFITSNPFSFLRIYLISSDFLDLMRQNRKSFTVLKEGSQFDYSIVEL